MNSDPINLDARRTSAERHRTAMRRRPANLSSHRAPSRQPQPGRLEGQIAAEPARTWPEVMQKWRFLLERFSETPDAGDHQTQRLIQRAIGDMERLKRREEQ